MPKPAKDSETALARRRGPIFAPNGLLLPAVIARAGERPATRFLKYFAAEIRNL